MTRARCLLGKQGEGLAVGFLKKRGFEILHENYRCRLGEIDIIAREGDVLAFIEVKTRRNETFGHPAEAVTIAKQKKIIRVACWYLQEQGGGDQSLRFDVVSVFCAADPPALRLIRDAFQVER